MMEEKILDIVKARLNRLPEETQLDEYLLLRIRAVMEELADQGIHLADTVRDMVLVGDIVVWRYGNRDEGGNYRNGAAVVRDDMPDWMRRDIRARWLAEWGCGV